MQEAARILSVGPHMDHRLVVGVDTPPAGQMVERGNCRRLRLEQGPSNVITVEKIAKHRRVAAFGGEVGGEEIVAVQLNPSVDKSRDAREDQIAAKGLAVEDGPSKREA